MTKHGRPNWWRHWHQEIVEILSCSPTPLSTKTLCDEFEKLSNFTVKHAVDKLDDHGIVESEGYMKYDITDQGEKYAVNRRSPGHEIREQKPKPRSRDTTDLDSTYISWRSGTLVVALLVIVASLTTGTLGFVADGLAIISAIIGMARFCTAWGNN